MSSLLIATHTRGKKQTKKVAVQHYTTARHAHTDISMAGRVVTIAAGTITIKERAYMNQHDIAAIIAPASLLAIEQEAFRYRQHNAKSKWRNIWIRDVFCSLHLGGQRSLHRISILMSNIFEFTVYDWVHVKVLPRHHSD